MPRKFRRASSWAIIWCMLIFTVLIVGCGSKAPIQKSGSEKPVIRFAAAKAGGSWYPLAVAIGDIWKSADIIKDVSVLPGGGINNVVSIGEGKVQVGFSQPPVALPGVRGDKEYYEKAYPNVKTMAILYPDFYHLAVWKDSNIMTVKDLKGKRLNAGTKGYLTEVLTSLALKVNGFDYSQTKQVQLLGDADAVDMMKDGHFDAIADCGGLPESAFVDLGTQKPIRLLPFSDTEFAEITKINPAVQRRTIPAGLYNGVDSDVPGIGSNLMIMVGEDVSEALVYEMTKSLAEKLPKLGNVTAAMKDFDPKGLALDVGIEFHSGAAKYYKEQGWIK